MDKKTELLISLGAATAVNCVYCFEHYFEKAVAAGVTTEEVLQAADLAAKVKTGAGVVIKKSIDDITGRREEYNRLPGETSAHPCCC